MSPSRPECKGVCLCQVPAELRSGHAPFSSLTLPAARSSAAFRSPITQAHTPVPLSRLTHQHHAHRAFTRFRWNALRQQMAEEESGAWGSVDTRDVIVRLTGQQTNHATSKLLTL